MRAHVTSFFWNLDKKATPMIKLVKENGLEEYLPLNRNKIVNVTQDYGKKCVGYYKDGEFHECPDNAVIEKGQKCDKCSRMDEYLVCAKCTGKECLACGEIRKNCFEKTHFLYLTLIGDSVKVGITHAGRYLKRWIEQGSDYSCIISSGNGMEIRRKESILAKEISDRMGTPQKMKVFMKDDIKILEEFLDRKKLNVPIINVRRYYDGLDSIPKKPCVYDGLLNGRIVCVKGRIIIFEKEDEYYYYDINDLLAHDVEITHI